MTISGVVSALRAIDDIMRCEVRIPLPVAWKLHKAYKSLDEVADYAFSRLDSLINDFGKSEMDDNEKLIYQTVMDSEVEVCMPSFTEDEIMGVGDDVTATLPSMKGLSLLVG